MHPYLARWVLKLSLKMLIILEHESLSSVLDSNTGEELLFHSPKRFLSSLIKNFMELALLLVARTVLLCYLANLFGFGEKTRLFPYTYIGNYSHTIYFPERMRISEVQPLHVIAIIWLLTNPLHQVGQTEC